MGKGGQSETVIKKPQEETVWKSSYNPLDPKAPEVPTKGQVKAMIPKHCFERSYVKSMYYVFQDSAMSVALTWATTQMVSATEIPSIGEPLKLLWWMTVWSQYAFWQGTIWTGLWVLAHECGHGAFSPSQTFNDIVGYILHQALLVPYFAWQYTHAKHHRRTNHLADGESHVPSDRADNGLGEHDEREGAYAVIHEALGDGAFAGFQVFTHLAIGWPLYLLGLASTGRVDYKGKDLEGRVMDHYRPTSPMFPPKVSTKIALSTAGVVVTLIGIGYAMVEYGVLPVMLWYIAPYHFTNAWLVLYTWLQHTDPSVPQYGDDEWTWVRGAITTIDRPYGIFDFFHHRIGSTHVAHHFFHEMPHYHAKEATVALKEGLGPLYNYDPAPWYKAMWRIAKTCHYVESREGIQYYKSLEAVPLTKDLKKKAE